MRVETTRTLCVRVSFAVLLSVVAAGCSSSPQPADTPFGPAVEPEARLGAQAARLRADFDVTCDPFHLCVFTDTSVSVRAPIVSWQWDFGDGSPLVAVPSPTHQFPGTESVRYPVTLTVTDASGATDSVQRNVRFHWRWTGG